MNVPGNILGQIVRTLRGRPATELPVRPARPRSAGRRLHRLAGVGRNLEFAATQGADASRLERLAQVEIAPLVVRAQCLASRGAPAVPQVGRQLTFA